MLLRPALPLLLALLLAACGGGGGGDDGPSAPTPGAVQTDGSLLLPIVATALASGTLGGSCKDDEAGLPAVLAACEDLASRFDRTPEEVRVLSVTPNQWPDSCLGVTYLTEQDEVCAQVVTLGYEVALKLDDNTYTYHTDREGTIVRVAGLEVLDVTEIDIPSD